MLPLGWCRESLINNFWCLNYEAGSSVFQDKCIKSEREYLLFPAPAPSQFAGLSANEDPSSLLLEWSDVVWKKVRLPWHSGFPRTLILFLQYAYHESIPPCSWHFTCRQTFTGCKFLGIILHIVVFWGRAGQDELEKLPTGSSKWNIAGAGESNSWEREYISTGHGLALLVYLSSFTFLRQSPRMWVKFQDSRGNGDLFPSLNAVSFLVMLDKHFSNSFCWSNKLSLIWINSSMHTDYHKLGDELRLNLHNVNVFLIYSSVYTELAGVVTLCG